MRGLPGDSESGENPIVEGDVVHFIQRNIDLESEIK
jgi:hypothetical protein